MTPRCGKCVTLTMLCFALGLPLLHGASGPSCPQVTIFRIGTFDRSSAEFSSTTPTHSVSFMVSQSDPAKDWFGAQPAVLGLGNKSRKTDISAAPRAITFTLHGSRVGSYELHIALLVESASVPALIVGINDKTGIFYLHPRLDYSNGDQWDSFDPAYSSADVDFTFPGRYLHVGINTITLQVVEQAQEAVPDARLNYDAIELDAIPRSLAYHSVSTQLEPTIFFRQKNGELFELINAFIRHSGRLAAGTKADLIIEQRRYDGVLKGENDFGDDKVEYWVPEFHPLTKAELIIGARKHPCRQTISPAKKWTIFVVPHIHLDVGYSDYQAKVAAIQSRTIDEALDMIDRNPDFRFSMDGEWTLQQFLSTRTVPQKQRAIEAIEKKQLFVPAQYVNVLTGIAGTEVLIRSLYPSANLSTKYGTSFNYANITDVPSYSWSYASILASAGIPFLAAGSDNYRAPVLFQGHLNEKSPMWWIGPDGKKVLLWYSRAYLQMQMLFGLPPVLAAGRDTLPLFLQMYANPGYRASSTLLYGTQVENTDLFPQQAHLVDKWNSVYAYPRLRYSGFYEALQDIAAQFGDAIPTIRGDGGPYWEDGEASDARYLAQERRNEAQGLTAEKLDTLTSLVDPLIKADTTDLDHMWTDMVLMDEHTFDSSNSISDPTSQEAIDQLTFKEHYAVNAATQADFITRRSMASLANSIPAGPGSVVVFNSLNWKRSGLVSLDLSKSDEIVDVSTNHSISYEILFTGNDFQHVRFLAQNVPAVGYKIYLLRPAKETPHVSVTQQSTALENQYYKMQLDPETGAVRSIYDKQLNRELVNQNGPYRFGEYLYVTGGDKYPNTMLVYGHVFPKPALEVHPANSGRITSIEVTPFGMVARLESKDLNTPLIETEIRLFNYQKKIEFVEEVDKEEIDSKEAVYFAFPFAFTHPQFQYEIQNGVVDPAKDTYPGAGHEWFSMQHWISVQQDGASGSVLPLDAPLVTLGDIDRGDWPDVFGERPGTIFSYVMNNYWNTNYRAGQGGHFVFHYIVTSGASTNAASLSRIGWEEATPLETDIITSQDKAAVQSTPDRHSEAHSAEPLYANALKVMDGVQRSFLETSDPDILLETWKAAEDGKGAIMRFVDFGGTEREVSVRIPWLHLDRIWQTDAVERDRKIISVTQDGQFHFIINPYEIVTMRIVGERK